MATVYFTAVSRPIRRVIIGVAVLMVVACSDDPPATGSSVGFDLAAVRACELLAPSDIEAATGLAVGAGQDVSQVGGRLPMCSWPRAGSDTEVLSLLVTHSGHADFAAFVASARDNAFGDVLGDADLEEVTDVGRFGVWMPEAMMLQAYGDPAMVQVQVTVAPGRDALEAAKTLARAAIAKVR